MYKLTVEIIGKHKIFCLSNEDSSFFIKFIPDKGATVYDLRLNQQNIYDAYTNSKDLDVLAWSRGILLAPFPNRLKEGKYSFEGIDYQFPINDPSTETALHGFINQLKFSLGAVETNQENASVSCHSSYDGELDYYPFPFSSKVCYSLDNETGFKLKFSLKNTGKSNMPVGLGWHPYFNLNTKVNETLLRLPNLDIVEIDSNMIPTGQGFPFVAFEKPTPIDDFVLDNCFKLKKETEVATVTLEGEKGKLIYSQNTDIPYLQIYTPPHRKSIALEPMTCNIDAFNNGNGLKILAPGETISLECKLFLEANSLHI